MSNGFKDLEKLKTKSYVKSMNCGDFNFDFNYYDEENNIKVDLFSDIAENIVKECFKFNVDSDYERRWNKKLNDWEFKSKYKNNKWDNKLPKNERKLIKNISLNQVRKFYNEFLNYKIIIDNSENNQEIFKKQLPYIRMLKAKANVAYQRGHINTNFKMFIEGNIDYIKDDMDKFNIFVTFFEAVVAYSKGVLKD